MRACGFVHSTFVTVPRISIGLEASYWAANEWCADAVDDSWNETTSAANNRKYSCLIRADYTPRIPMWKIGDHLTHRFNPELGVGRVTAIEGRALVVHVPDTGTTL